MCNNGPCKTLGGRLTVIRELAINQAKRDLFFAPNLDGFTTNPDKLMEVWAAIHFNPIKCARILFPERQKRYVSVTKDLGSYASNKANAMTYRLKGQIQTAISYEQICESIYERLPVWARW